MNIYNIINRLDKKEFFYIFFIVIFSIGIIKLIQPNNTLLLGILLSFIIIFIYISKVIYIKDTSDNTLQYKYNSLLIKPESLILKYPNIINFLYDIREYYEYNLAALDELIIELNNFFILYDDLISRNYIDCEYIYDNLSGIKLKLINILSTYIYSIPDDIFLMDNLAIKQKEFDTILQEYLNNIINNCIINSFKKSKPLPANSLE
jgi:hypothetical protein